MSPAAEDLIFLGQDRAILTVIQVQTVANSDQITFAGDFRTFYRATLFALSDLGCSFLLE